MKGDSHVVKCLPEVEYVLYWISTHIISRKCETKKMNVYALLHIKSNMQALL